VIRKSQRIKNSRTGGVSETEISQRPESGPLFSAIDQNPAAAIVYGIADVKILHANSHAESLLGVRNGELVGRPVTKFFTRSDRPESIASELQASRSIVDRITPCNVRDSNVTWLNCSHKLVTCDGVEAIYTVLTDVTDIKLAEAEAAAASLEATAFTEISSLLAKRRPGEAVFDAVANVINTLIPFDRVGIALLDPSEATFRLVFVRGTDIEGRAQGTVHSVDDSLNSYVTNQRRGLILEVGKSESLLERFPSLKTNVDAGLKSFLTAPMVADDKIVGTISLRSTCFDAYSDRHLLLLERVASLLAPALEQARLYSDLEVEAQERQIIAEIGRVISSSPDVGSVYARFTDLARQIIPADRVAITSVDEETNQFVILHYVGMDTPDRQEGQAVPLDGSLVQEVARSRRPVLLRAIDRDQMARDYSTLLPLYDAGLRSFLSIPLLVSDRPTGSIHFFSKNEDEFDRHHVLLAESVASQIAGVIATAQLRQAEQQAALENASIADIGRIISSSLDTRDIFEAFAERVAEILPCDRLVITTLDLELGVATDNYVSGVEVPGWVVGTEHPIAGSQFEEVILNRQTSVSKDLPERADTDGSVEPLTQSGLRGSIMVPLFSNGEVLGTLNLKSKYPDIYTKQRVQLAERIANQIAGAIANSNLYTDVQKAADERRALAKIGLAATRNLNIRGVYERMAKSVNEIVPYDRISITLFDDDGETLRVAYTGGAELGDYMEGGQVAPALGDPHRDDEWKFESGLAIGTNPDHRLSAIVHAPLGSRNRHLGYVS
jgi:PAS domain S-box-containing protein